MDITNANRKMNKQLTAMQELIEYLEQNMQSAENKYSKAGLKISIRKATELLSKEKEQIQLAYHDGFMKSEISYISHTYPIPQVIQCTEEYYQNTYQNKSITQ